MWWVREEVTRDSKGQGCSGAKGQEFDGLETMWGHWRIEKSMLDCYISNGIEKEVQVLVIPNMLHFDGWQETKICLKLKFYSNIGIVV